MVEAGIVYDMFARALYTHRENLGPLLSGGASNLTVSDCTGFFVTLDNGSDARQAAVAMRQNPSVGRVVVAEEITGGLSDLLESSYGMLDFFFFVSMAIAFVVSGSAVIISSMERDVEFATLDTPGFRVRHVLKAMLAEMLVLGLGAAILGVPLAYAFAFLLSRIMAEVIFYFPIAFMLGATFSTFALGLAFVLLSTAVPARYASGLDTERTMRERTAG